MAKSSNFEFFICILVILAILWITGGFILPYIVKRIEQFNDLNARLQLAKNKRTEYIEARKELMNAVDSEENNLALRGVY